MTAHFTPETFAFLADLDRNNDRDWFEASRDRYEAHWKAPALALIAAVAPRLAALDPALKAEARINGSLRRINRDVRFSHDKSPYNPRLHLVFWACDHPNRSPGLHVVLHAESVGWGTGLYGLTPDRLARFRDMVMDPVELRGLETALAAAEADGCTLGEPDLARLPKGFAAEGRQAELLRYKSVVARTRDTDAPPAVLQGPDAPDWIAARAAALLPLIRWLSAV